MRKYIKILSILLISLLVSTENDFELNGLQGQCSAYCFFIIQPLIEHTVSIQEKEEQIRMQANILDSLKQEVTDLRAKVGIYEAEIRKKDLQLDQQMKTVERFENETKDTNNVIAQLVLGLNRSSQLQLEIKDNLAVVKAVIDQTKPSSCIGKLTDVYEIQVPGIESFLAPCDSNLAGIGWTVIQRRKDGSENFNRNWTDYRNGFGDLRGEFFIGLEKLHLITNSQSHELYIYLEDFQNEHRFAKYSKFSIGNEKESYEIKSLGNFNGDAGDALIHHINMKFSTHDRDNDKIEGNCAISFSSGWWYSDCFMSNLNAQYSEAKVEDADLQWRTWHLKPLKFVQMMIRPTLN